MTRRKKIITLSILSLTVLSISFLSYRYKFKKTFTPAAIGKKYISIKNGYLWDPSLNINKGDYWIPLGIAYQTWNRPLNQWQDEKELKADLDGISDIGADAVRADFVWGHIEIQKDLFDWTRYDLFLQECKKRGIRVFPLIGYQWPPAWFPAEWKTKHPPDPQHQQSNWDSDIISYEHPKARERYYKFIETITRRYSKKGERADLGSTIAAWVIGNEYGYLGLWSMKYDGYDEASVSSFRKWLEKKYISIDRLNKTWKKDGKYLPGYPYKTFKEAEMPAPYGFSPSATAFFEGRDKASWYDLLEWRNKSIGDFIALGAKATKEADPDHLITYSFLSMFYSEIDYYNQSEDIATIVESCKKNGYPLDFWSINNYPRNTDTRDREMSSAKFGLIRAMAESKLPVLVTETGVSSDPSLPDYISLDPEEQGKIVSNTVLESLINKAMGIMVFHWNDRNYERITEYESKFGLVTIDKKKKPAFYQIKKLFSSIRDKDIINILLNSEVKKPDIALFRDTATDSINQRYIIQAIELFGTINRCGYTPGFIGHDEFINGEYKNYKAIVLPRNQKMHDDILKKLKDASLATKIHADADIPAVMDEYGNYRNKDKNWIDLMEKIFGINVSKMPIDENLEDGIYPDGFFELPSLNHITNIVPIECKTIGFKKDVYSWKNFSDHIPASSGEAIAYFGNPKRTAAIVINKNKRAAISLFPLGDNTLSYRERTDFIKLIYGDKLGLKPYLEISNPNIWTDYLKYPDKNIMLLMIRNLGKKTVQRTTIKIKDLKVRAVDTVFNNLETDPEITYVRNSLSSKLQPLQTLLLRLKTTKTKN